MTDQYWFHRIICYQAGDGIVVADFKGNTRLGGNIFEVTKDSKEQAYRLTFSNQLSLKEVKVGSSVFLNSSPKIEGSLRKTFSNKEI